MSLPDSPDNRLDRYLAGELSGQEQRELAQAALDDPELFDRLTAAAVVKATVLRDSGPESRPAVEPRPRSVDPASSEFRRWPEGASVRPFKKRSLALTWTVVMTVAAAAIAFVIVYRSSSSTVPPPRTTASTPSTTSNTDAAAVADSTRAARQPLILTARLDELAGRSTAEFRSSIADTRPPKSEGIVVSVDDGDVAVDLGSLDGLAKGSELQVFRGSKDGEVVGRLTIATVFRERSRGRAASAGSLQVGDRAEVAPAVQVAALLEQVAARMAAGDAKAARGLAERAVSRSGLPGVPPDRRRRALGQLGTLEHRAGALDDAERHLRAAMDDFDAAPAATGVERAEIMNELSAVLIERGDDSEAERILRAAQPYAAGAAGVHVTNNLAALAALRGDRIAAEALYRSALALAGTSPDFESDRRAIEKNLEELRASR